MKTAFTATRLYTPVEEIQNPLLVVEDGLISEVSSRSTKEVPANASLVDFGDAVLAPGFVDIHMHGGAGVDVMRASPSELPRLGRVPDDSRRDRIFSDHRRGTARCDLRGAGTIG